MQSLHSSHSFRKYIHPAWLWAPEELGKAGPFPGEASETFQLMTEGGRTKCIRGQAARKRLAKTRIYRQSHSPENAHLLHAQDGVAPRCTHRAPQPRPSAAPGHTGWCCGVHGLELRVPGSRPTPDSQLRYSDPEFNLSKLSFLICIMGTLLAYLIRFF